MKERLLTGLKKVCVFLLVAGISFFVLVMIIGGSELLSQGGFLSFILALMPFVLPVILGYLVARKISPSKEKAKASTAELQKPDFTSDIPSEQPEKIEAVTETPSDATGRSVQVSKKPFYTRWWVWAIAAIFLISSCSAVPNEDELTANNPISPTVPSSTVSSMPTTFPTEESVQETTEAAETVATKEATETAAPDLVSIETAVQIIDNVLAESFTNYTITHNEALISVDVWEYGIAAGVDAAARGDAGCVETWNELVDSQKRCCTSIYDLVQTMGLSDVSIAINVRNDVNQENTLLSIVNGVVAFNCLDDLTIIEIVEPTISEAEETLSPREQLDAILETYDAEEFDQDTTYVLNTNTMKFHYKWCSSAGNIKPSNRLEVTTSRTDVISRGYQACKRCDP